MHAIHQNSPNAQPQPHQHPPQHSHQGQNAKPTCWKTFDHPNHPNDSRFWVFRVYGICPEFPEVIFQIKFAF
jgi:uncharacterized protein Usg